VRVSGLLGCLSSEVDSLAPFPSFGGYEVDQNHAEYDSPFPSETVDEENLVVDDGDVDDGELTILAWLKISTLRRGYVQWREAKDRHTTGEPCCRVYRSGTIRW
jgi:hypothetical protein